MLAFKDNFLVFESRNDRTMLPSTYRSINLTKAVAEAQLAMWSLPALEVPGSYPVMVDFNFTLLLLFDEKNENKEIEP